MTIQCRYYSLFKKSLTFELLAGEPLLIQYLQNNRNRIFNLTLKIYKQKRTLSQNAFFHLLISEIAFKIYGQRTEYLTDLIKQGIKEKYGYRIESPFDRNIFIPKPSRQCNKFEEFSVLIEGCFNELIELDYDITEFLKQYEKIKKDRLNDKL